MNVEGISLAELKALPAEELDTLMAFGKPISFHIGSANVLAEFNRGDTELSVNLAHIDGGGEGVLLRLWKAVEDYARSRNYRSVQWNVHALTCPKPNPRLQAFLREHGFTEADHETYGRIFVQQRVL